MNKIVLNRLLIQSVLLRWKSQITWLKYVKIELLIHQHPNSYIELIPIYQKWILNVFLYHNLPFYRLLPVATLTLYEICYYFAKLFLNLIFLKINQSTFLFCIKRLNFLKFQLSMTLFLFVFIFNLLKIDSNLGFLLERFLSGSETLRVDFVIIFYSFSRFMKRIFSRPDLLFWAI